MIKQYLVSKQLRVVFKKNQVFFKLTQEIHESFYNSNLTSCST